MYRFRIEVLREAAAKLGDSTGYAIYRRTGIAESSVYRILAGRSQPDLISVLLMGEAYDVPVEELMQRVPESIPA
ncbi:XRE family transcriptional regulator [Streptomyces scopuliridis]|uniref:XRE family transcriptional regulator n=1 Tax=Streptomyces scopuliridis TaxID=452529 RepID=UPI0036BAF1D8